MTHADIVSLIWGGLGALLIAGVTIASVFHSMYESDEDQEETP